MYTTSSRAKLTLHDHILAMRAAVLRAHDWSKGPPKASVIAAEKAPRTKAQAPQQRLKQEFLFAEMATPAKSPRNATRARMSRITLSSRPSPRKKVRRWSSHGVYMDD